VTSIFFQSKSSEQREMSNTDPNKIFDFVFIGLGASNSLILISMIKKGLLDNKQVAVFETDKKANNDKTYCFWASPDEPITRELEALISRRFTKIKVSAGREENIESCPYHYIRSIDLYDATRKFVSGKDIAFINEAVGQITEENQIHTLQTPKTTYQTKYIFDSRPPALDTTSKSEITLHQSFLGWHIKCEADAFQENVFEMMNFDIEQDGCTQFMYVIPFSTNEALVEFTRFGAEKIDQTYAEKVLKKFISHQFSNYEKLGEERGCIPMTTQINSPSKLKGVLNTGASANLIKPSTGYGFKNMFQFAQLVTKKIENQEFEHFNKIQIPSKKRFKFYDKLLLIILLRWPSVGKKIFTQLFNKIPVLTIFSFLEEKSTLRDEVRIFRILPIKPFLQALFLYLKNKFATRYIIALAVIILHTITSLIHLQTANYLSYILLFIGLMWIGIPHGALDHLLSKNKNTTLPIFVLKYLLIMSAYLVLWLFAPILSLVLFILYAAFHFGESELIQNKEEVKSAVALLKAFFMGLSILTFIITTHLKESSEIIVAISHVNILSYNESQVWVWSSWLSIISFGYILFESLKQSLRSHLGLMFLLLLGTLAPLILAFGLYFILQHSNNAWGHLKQGLGMNTIELYKKSAFFTFGALLIFVFIAFFIRDYIDLSGLWANFFIFIACISLPHFVMMHLFYNSKTEFTTIN
jgi:lycopene beta-cyclase